MREVRRFERGPLASRLNGIYEEARDRSEVRAVFLGGDYFFGFATRWIFSVLGRGKTYHERSIRFDEHKFPAATRR